MYNFDSYNVLLSIATNIPVLLMTAFVLQGHMCQTASVTGHVWVKTMKVWCVVEVVWDDDVVWSVSVCVRRHRIQAVRVHHPPEAHDLGAARGKTRLLQVLMIAR